MPIFMSLGEGQNMHRDFSATGLSESEIANILNMAVPFGFWRTEYATGHVYFSRRTWEIYGLPHSDAPANLVEVNKRIHPEDLKVALEMFEVAAREKIPFDYTLRVNDQSGGYKFVRSCGLYRDTPDGAGMMIGIFHEANHPVS